MDSTQKPNLSPTIIITVLVVVLLLFLIFQSRIFPQQPSNVSTPTPKGAPINILPKDLRVISGKVIEKSNQAITVEWTVPIRTDLRNFRKETKHIAWSKDTVFAPEKLKPKDIKINDIVEITATQPLQEHYELTASQIKVVGSIKP